MSNPASHEGGPNRTNGAPTGLGSWTRRTVLAGLGATGLAAGFGRARAASHDDTATTQTYDLIITGGRVLDPESMLDAVRNVGVKDGRITAITKADIEGDRTIDATGLVVAPGFIDTHFHAVDPFATKLALRDGVTTGMDLELGILHTSDWYDEKATTGWQVNYGATAGLSLCRMTVHDPEVTIDEPLDFSKHQEYVNKAAADGVAGWSTTRSDIDQMNQVMRQLDEELRQGALGVGILAAYMARGLTSYELFEAQRTAARYGRLASVHTRFHGQGLTPTEATLGTNEVLMNATLLDAPLIVAHDNDYGWWETEEKLQLARAKGYNVWGEYYPYIAGSTFVSAEFLRPEIFEDKLGFTYEESIYDPQTDRFLDREGYQALVENDPGQVIVLFNPQRKKWLPYWLRIPQMTVGSDAMLGVGTDGNLLSWDADYTEYAGHPRTAGSMAKTLRLAREMEVPLLFTLSQLSYWSAKHLGDAGLEAMQERGRVQVGKIADLTLFDPETVTDNATYKAGENGVPSTGIPYVIVDGTVVVDDSEVLDVKPGQPIRYPVETAPRFESLSERKWIQSHTIMAKSIPHFDDTGAGSVLEDTDSHTTADPSDEETDRDQ
ncbi:amidohydrolase family protein [Haloarchaeobius sp. HME9146]|uniref:amidohydrolase family protein n=1 Tax=Haloarchaeobius sp. HME9146 TaxID=2978732 RepID=UPI0021BEDA2C|nr:amidohydrolase family protein [Haloarchaeobius sp. HME9146]MCT9098431.1 amidohydrolase family protein [Haloarchaeobius sp. HME9146]